MSGLLNLPVKREKHAPKLRMEVVRAVEVFRYFAGEAWRVGGDVLPADTPHTLLYSVRVPLGVVAIITPWNFPLSIPVWKMAPALVMGNTVVLKAGIGHTTNGVATHDGVARSRYACWCCELCDRQWECDW